MLRRCERFGDRLARLALVRAIRDGGLAITETDWIEWKSQTNLNDKLQRLDHVIRHILGFPTETPAELRVSLKAMRIYYWGSSQVLWPVCNPSTRRTLSRRRELTIRLSRATHGAPAAIMSACVVATMAAWAIEQHAIEAVVAAGLREADDFAELHGLAPAALQPLRQAAEGAWGPYRPGMPLDAVATVASVLHVLREATSLANAMKRAVALGGDTDTTAAIVGGILGCRIEDVDHAIPWLAKVVLPGAEIVEVTAADLCALRGSRHG